MKILKKQRTFLKRCYKKRNLPLLAGSSGLHHSGEVKCTYSIASGCYTVKREIYPHIRFFYNFLSNITSHGMFFVLYYCHNS
jgi:hypothetical protein